MLPSPQTTESALRFMVFRRSIAVPATLLSTLMIASIFVNKVLDLFLPPHIGLVRLTESTLMVSCSITSKLSVLQNSIQQTPYLTYFHFIGSDPTYPLPAAFLPSFQKQAVPNSTSGSYCFLDDRSTVPWSVPHSARS